MKIAFLLVVTCQAAMADSIFDVQKAGAVLESGHRWEEAAQLYRTALARLAPADSPERFWLLTSLAEVSFESGQYEQTRLWLKQAGKGLRSFAHHPSDDARILNGWGALHLVEGNLTAAERDLARAAAISSGEERASALHNLAGVQMQAGDLSAATTNELEALQIWTRLHGDKGYVRKAWLSLSSLQALQGNWQAAEQSIRKALAIAETPEALQNYVVILDGMKRGAEASALRNRLAAPSAYLAPLVDVKALRNNFRVRAK